MVKNNYKVAIMIGCASVLALACLTVTLAHGNTIDTFVKSIVHGPHIGDDAPAFKGHSTKGMTSFPEQYVGKWVILISYPSDFRPVSDSEIKKLASMATEFENLGAKIICLSPDHLKVHERWLADLTKPISIDGKKKESAKITFPIIADEDKQIARKYDMVHTNESAEEIIRSIYIIDPMHKIRFICHSPIANARNFPEIKRTLQALQTSERQKVATLVDWNCTCGNTIPIEKESKSIKNT